MTQHHQDQAQHEAQDQGERADLAALTSVEATGRLAVYAWAALEKNDPGEAMRLLGEITQMAASAVGNAGLDEEQSARVRQDARDRVGPLVGWANGATPHA